MRTYKLYATMTATADSMAAVQIAQNCRILGVSWAVSVSFAVGASSGIMVELSTSSIRQIITNDALNIVDYITAYNTYWTAASQAPHAANKFTGPLSIPVKAGDRLLLHGNALTTNVAGSFIACLVYTSN